MDKTHHFKTRRGTPLPYGATLCKNGYNFSLFSAHAVAVSLCLFEPSSGDMVQEIQFDPKYNRTGNIWHVCVEEIPHYFHYGYRLDGPYDPLIGLYYDKRKILLDPFARQVATSTEWGEKQYEHQTIKGVIDPIESSFDWGDDTHPHIPLKELIIYEMHVRGFTNDPSSNVANKGTFLGMIEKIPYLKSLGINAVELMPIFEFNENDNPHLHPVNKQPLKNYWGYSTVNFFSPMNRYAAEFQSAISEFKQLVKELHAHGIEVILDVVYNHTGEGNNMGPTLSFKGIENPAYYILGPNGEYYNFSGCGNTFNANHPVVRKFIVSSLRYWVQEMHVDGFRFDLASILTRSKTGAPMESPPLIEAISYDPIFARTKLIAEAWDAAGLYQVGSFPSYGVWAEWNGKFRDDVRGFLKGTDGKVGFFATRLSGSEDLYGKGRHPYHSINFVTSHDGFTLRDLVSYNTKHNEGNGENNRDGDNNNLSWNCGEEGKTQNRRIQILRQRQMRNFMLALMVSQGVPMILMGDEYGHTKNGNNNSWCQDGPINWFQWEDVEKNIGLWNFYTALIHFRKEHPILHRAHFLRKDDITWHGQKPHAPDWSPSSRFIALTLTDQINNYDLYIAFNAYSKTTTIELPQPGENRSWFVVADTSKRCPRDFIHEDKLKPHAELTHTMRSYTSMILKTGTL